MNLGLMKEFPVTMPLLAFSRILQAATLSQMKPDACLLHCCASSKAWLDMAYSIKLCKDQHGRSSASPLCLWQSLA